MYTYWELGLTTIVRPVIAPYLTDKTAQSMRFSGHGMAAGMGMWGPGAPSGGRDFRDTCRGFRGGGAVTPGNRARNIPEKVKQMGS